MWQRKFERIINEVIKDKIAPTFLEDKMKKNRCTNKEM